ncbi:unnamed protein product, partial [Rotaria sordida]
CEIFQVLKSERKDNSEPSKSSRCRSTSE